MYEFANVTDPTVRNEMMEHLPHFLMVCHELELPLLAGIVDRLVPIVVCSVTDTNNQVPLSTFK